MNLKRSLIIQYIKILKLLLWIIYSSFISKIIPIHEEAFYHLEASVLHSKYCWHRDLKDKRHDVSWDDSLPLLPAGPATDLQPRLQFILRGAFFCLICFIISLPLWWDLLGHNYISIRRSVSLAWVTNYISISPVASSQFIYTYTYRYHESSTHCWLTLKL